MSLYAILRRMLGQLNEQVVDHGERLSYLYLKLSQYRGVPDDRHMEEMMLLCFAHDIGAYKTEQYLDILNFDMKKPMEHCIYGYLFMKYFSPCHDAAEVLLYHHTPYSGKDSSPRPYVDDGILIHLLDRTDIANLGKREPREVMEKITGLAGREFAPSDAADLAAAEEKYGILSHLRDGSYRDEVREYFDRQEHVERLLVPVIGMLAYEIDFKSEQTVIHSITITYIARVLGERLGLSEEEVDRLEIAARIHDLGKIRILGEILEKPAKLTKEEYEVMKKHIVYTEEITSDIFPEDIVRIAVNHHERLDGNGYSRGLGAEDLTVSDRILQIADVASALLQRRSYKDAMGKELTVGILKGEADAGRLDAEITGILVDGYDEIIPLAFEKSRHTLEMYQGLKDEFERYLDRYMGNSETTVEEFELFPLKS